MPSICNATIYACGMPKRIKPMLLLAGTTVVDPDPLFILPFAALLLAACDTTTPAPQAAAPAPAATDVTPDSFKMPAGEGCAGDVARYRAIMDNDLSMGHVAKSVYNQIEKDIGEADSQCAAGHEAQARATIVASRKRHGYPADL